VVHIAGTNGKGSTAAMVAALLQSAGYRTGLNTSPHLVIPNERIRVNGKMVDDGFIIKQVTEWKPLIDEFQLTFFEVLTALALCYFVEQDVDYAVLETGLGGRLDATNVVDPEIAVITAIDRDHIRILGDTLEAIAGEKAGIIKAGRPVLLSDNVDEVIEVIRNRATKLQAPFHMTSEICRSESVSLQGLVQRVDYRIGKGVNTVQLGMLGRHQISNLLTALACLEILGIKCTHDQIQQGIEAVHWPARMEVLREDPLIFYDVAHNPAGVQRLLETLAEADLDDAVLLAGLNEKKDRRSILRLLQDWSGEKAYFAFEGHSGCSHEGLLADGVGAEHAFRDMQTGLAWAMEHVSESESNCICIFGSHYFATDLYDVFEITTR